MTDGTVRSGQRRIRGTSFVVLMAAAMLLAACSGGSGGSSGNAGAPGSAPAKTTEPPAKVSIAVTPSADKALSPTQPIEIKATQGKLTKVAVTNPTRGNAVTGTFNADKTSWQSNEDLAYGVGYQVVADGVDADGKTTEKKSTVNTVKPAATAYPSLIPPPSTKLIGVGQPIVVKFDHDVDKAKAEKNMKVTSSAGQEGSWYWISSREAHYRAKDFWTANSDVKVDIGIYGKELGGNVYGDTDRTASYHVGDSMVAKADGRSEKMQIFKNGKMIKSMPISMGKDKTPTHSGVHVVSDKQASLIMDSCSYGVCKGDPNYYREKERWAERISNDGEFVHENPASVSAQGSTNVSHGCINLNGANAKWFFDNFGPGDVVEVTNSGGPKLPVWDTYGDWALSWSEWKAGSAL
jgi:lipoprotein-anchoring transpeptidase ErfK/SrfK